MKETSSLRASRLNCGCTHGSRRMVTHKIQWTSTSYSDLAPNTYAFSGFVRWNVRCVQNTGAEQAPPSILVLTLQSALFRSDEALGQLRCRFRFSWFPLARWDVFFLIVQRLWVVHGFWGIDSLWVNHILSVVHIFIGVIGF